jgi:hypothetical protein
MENVIPIAIGRKMADGEPINAKVSSKHYTLYIPFPFL